MHDSNDDTMSPEDTAKLAALSAQYPRWSMWKGRHTGQWWACPPLGDLFSEDGLDALAATIAAAEERTELS